YKDGILEATLGNVLNYQVTGLTEATTYNFTVTALDADNNESPISNALSITTNVFSACDTPIETNLSDLDWIAAQQEYLTPARNTNISGGPMVINGQTFNHGIGSHAQSEIVYDISGSNYQNFKAYIGVDDSQGANTNASIQFEVYGDDILLFTSQTLTGADDAQFIDVDINGVNQLKLVLEKGANNLND
ncbi:NPCBM/NEW2 domain-containing protein, partial [Algibacter aquimarinus]|uniref:NPCBM/NEW2 domain-containing protein n=1 Tax=Algibacter aquimarinus TaxID=1136748 RepID=UPI0031E8485E